MNLYNFDNNSPLLQLVKVPEAPKPAKPDFEKGHWQPDGSWIIGWDMACENAENEHLGDADKRTGIYSDGTTRKPSEVMADAPQSPAAPELKAGDLVMAGNSDNTDAWVLREVAELDDNPKHIWFKNKRESVYEKELHYCALVCASWRLPTEAELAQHAGPVADGERAP